MSRILLLTALAAITSPAEAQLIQPTCRSARQWLESGQSALERGKPAQAKEQSMRAWMQTALCAQDYREVNRLAAKAYALQGEGARCQRALEIVLALDAQDPLAGMPEAAEKCVRGAKETPRELRALSLEVAASMKPAELELRVALVDSIHLVTVLQVFVRRPGDQRSLLFEEPISGPGTLLVQVPRLAGADTLEVFVRASDRNGAALLQWGSASAPKVLAE